MNHLKKITFTFVLLLYSNLSNASLDIKDFYVGAKVAKRTMGFKKNYGHSFFGRKLNQFGILAGVNLFNYFGLELEYFSTNKRKSTPIIYEGKTELGKIDFTGLDDGFTYDSNNKVYGASIQFKAHYPVLDNFKIFAAAGLSCVTVKINSTLLQGVAIGIPTPEEVYENSFSAMRHNKVVPKFTLGLDWKCTKNLGIKTEVSIENTNNMKLEFNSNLPGVGTLTAKAKKSYIYGLSVYATI